MEKFAKKVIKKLFLTDTYNIEKLSIEKLVSF